MVDPTSSGPPQPRHSPPPSLDTALTPSSSRIEAAIVLTETETCMRLITPALEAAGWDIQTQIRREYTFTDGRLAVRGGSAIGGRRRGPNTSSSG